MKTIVFNNSSKSDQDINEVKDALFNAILNGKSFVFVQHDGDGDNWANHYECLSTEHDYIETILGIIKPNEAK